MPGKCCRSITPATRLRRTAGWLLPGALLFFIPKCPACVAAYVALFTGISLSFSIASGLRVLLITLCLLSLAFALYRWFTPNTREDISHDHHHHG